MSFSALPVEVRLHIFCNLFTFDQPVNLHLLHGDARHWVWHALEVNHEFRTEGSRILYAANTFRLEIFSKPPRLSELLDRSKKAHVISLPRLPHWPASQVVDYNVTIPLPQTGTARTLRQMKLAGDIFQPEDHGGWHGFQSDYKVLRTGKAYHFADVEVPRQWWDARSLIKNIQIVAPKSVGRFWWSEVELAWGMVELLTTKYFPNLIRVELDLTAPLDHHGSFGICMPLDAPETPFEVKARQLQVVGRQCREVDRVITQRIKEAAKISGGLPLLGNTLDFGI